MEYYVAVAGEKVGPLSQFRLAEMLRDGEISADDKAWHKGLDGWIRLSEIPSMQSIVESMQRGGDDEEQKDPSPVSPPPSVSPPPLETRDSGPPLAEKKVGIAVEVRPLTRFWARYFDYTMVAVIVILFSDVELPKVDPGISVADLVNRYKEIFRSDAFIQLNRMMIYAIVIWHVVEGFLISLFGATPGKALFGIKVVTQAGGPVPILTSIGRSFLVFVIGMGMNFIYLLTIATMTFAFFRLMARGKTAWDQALRLEVRHPPLNIGRILLAILAFFALMLLQYLKIQ